MLHFVNVGSRLTPRQIMSALVRAGIGIECRLILESYPFESDNPLVGITYGRKIIDEYTNLDVLGCSRFEDNKIVAAGERRDEVLVAFAIGVPFAIELKKTNVIKDIDLCGIRILLLQMQRRRWRVCPYDKPEPSIFVYGTKVLCSCLLYMGDLGQQWPHHGNFPYGKTIYLDTRCPSFLLIWQNTPSAYRFEYELPGSQLGVVYP